MLFSPGADVGVGGHDLPGVAVLGQLLHGQEGALQLHVVAGVARHEAEQAYKELKDADMYRAIR